MDKFRDLIVQKIEDAKIVIAGIPYELGASCGQGTKDAPDTFRELSGYLPPFTKDGFDISDMKMYDFGNLKCNNLDEIYLDSLKVFSSDLFKIFIGGDHSVSIPLQKRFVEMCKKVNKIPAIIHIDAHPDICDVYDGSKYSHACPIRRAIDNGVDSSNIVLLGIRGYEAQEIEYFNLHREIKVYQASYINKYGYVQLIEEIKNKFNDDYLIYLSYDIDANDPSFAPGTGTPEAFGLNSITLLNIINDIVSSLNVNVWDIVEVSPKLDCNNITSWLALKTIYEVLYTIKNKEKK